MTRIAWSATLVVWLAVVEAAAVRAQLPPQELPIGRISGVVRRADTGDPVAGARVELVSERSNSRRYTRTDTSGRFVFPNLPLSSYLLTAEREGFAPAVARCCDGGGLGEGEAVDDLTMEMTAMGQVSGVVSERGGNPLALIPVQLLPVITDPNQIKGSNFSATTRTNDRGEYRLFNVPPGRYFVVAGMAAVPGEVDIFSGFRGINGINSGRNAYASQYFPGESGSQNATPVEVFPASERGGVDFSLSRQKVFRISGQITDLNTGKPPSGTVRIALQQQGRSSAITYETLRRQYEPPAQELNAYDPATGRFEIRGVFPGSYLLVATNEEQPRLTRVQISDKPFVPAAAYRSIEVNDADVDALSLMLAPGGALTGRVTVEGQEQSQKLTLSLPRIRLRPIFEDQLVRVSNLPDVSIESTLMVEGFEGGPFKADGKLHTNNIYPGEYNVDISGVPKGYYLKEARFNGGDVLQEPLRIAGPESGPLNIVIAPGAATIHGGLIHDQANAAGDDAADDEDNGAIVVVVPERPLRRFETLLIKQTSDTGDFTFEGLPPGDYRVVALAKDPDSPFMKPMTTETTLKARTLADQHGTLIHATGKEPLILTLRVVRPN